MGIVHPVRWASTDSSAHKVIRGSWSAARWAARTCLSVHGDLRHSGLQVRLRDAISGSGDTTAAGVLVSCQPWVVLWDAAWVLILSWAAFR